MGTDRIQLILPKHHDAVEDEEAYREFSLQRMSSMRLQSEDIIEVPEEDGLYKVDHHWFDIQNTDVIQRVWLEKV